MSTAESKALAPTLFAGNRALGIVPQTFDDCYKIAQLLAQSAIVPADYKDKAADCCVAIMQGLEVGLSPIAALNSIAVINGRASLWGDGAMAVVRASGLVESVDETDDGKEATCVIKRKGEPKPIVRKFSMADAKQAGLDTKKGPWTQYPQRMRQMRARSWALRDGFADVLKGLHIAEEAQDIPMRDITPRNEPRALDLPDIPDAPIKQAEETQPDKTLIKLVGPDTKFLDDLNTSFAVTISVDALNEVLVHNEIETEERGLQQKVADLYQKHKTRIYDGML